MYTVVCVQAPRLRRISVDDRYSLVHVGLVCRKDVLDVVFERVTLDIRT